MWLCIQLDAKIATLARYYKVQFKVGYILH